MPPAKIDFKNARQVLQGRPDIDGAWVFGSAQDGELHPGSDIDIAVLFSEPASFSQLADLASQLEKAMGAGEIDLVDLNGKSSVLRFEALSGRRLVCSNPDRVAEFQSLAAREHESDMATVEIALRATRSDAAPST